jgi:hypothetical protein
MSIVVSLFLGLLFYSMSLHVCFVPGSYRRMILCPLQENRWNISKINQTQKDSYCIVFAHMWNLDLKQQQEKRHKSRRRTIWEGEEDW